MPDLPTAMGFLGSVLGGIAGIPGGPAISIIAGGTGGLAGVAVGEAWRDGTGHLGYDTMENGIDGFGGTAPYGYGTSLWPTGPSQSLSGYQISSFDDHFYWT